MSPALSHAIGMTVMGLTVTGLTVAMLAMSKRVQLLTEMVRTLAQCQRDLTAVLLSAAETAQRHRDGERHHG